MPPSHRLDQSVLRSPTKARPSSSSLQDDCTPPADEANGQAVKRILAQPVDTTAKTSSRRARQQADVHSRDVEDADATSGAPMPPLQGSDMSSSSTAPSSASKPRRFAPQMVETSRRSRRNTDESSGMPEQDRTDSVSGPQELAAHLSRRRPDLIPGPPDNSPIVSSDHVPQVSPDSKFSSTKLAERIPRRHSFRIPDLPSIRSNSETEDDSDVSTISTTLSANSDHPHRAGRKRKITHPVLSVDNQHEPTPNYVLSVAASAAERQLREQFMAAYPNEVVHEPIEHYAGERDSLVDDHRTGPKSPMARRRSKRSERRRRDSDSDEDMAEMRRHQDHLEEKRWEAWAGGHELESGLVNQTLPNENASHKIEQTQDLTANGIKGWQNDTELKQMRKAAAPPMAGQDLVFPKCYSPKQTRLDVYQLPGAIKAAGDQSRQHSGLWTPAGGSSRENSQSGLWMGVNAASAQMIVNPPLLLQTGLVTPAIDRSDPFSKPSGSTASHKGSNLAPNRNQHLLPPTPPASYGLSTYSSSATVAQSTTSIEDELDDYFVTQVYNYLSLGYPILARQFDEELSKITKIPIDILRRDDYEEISEEDESQVEAKPQTARFNNPVNNMFSTSPVSIRSNNRVFSDGLPPITPTQSHGSSTKPRKKKVTKLKRPNASSARGYVGAPEGTGADVRGMRGGACERWLALRKYIWEWGRQQRLATANSTLSALGPANTELLGARRTEGSSRASKFASSSSRPASPAGADSDSDVDRYGEDDDDDDDSAASENSQDEEQQQQQKQVPNSSARPVSGAGMLNASDSSNRSSLVVDSPGGSKDKSKNKNNKKSARRCHDARHSTTKHDSSFGVQPRIGVATVPASWSSGAGRRKGSWGW